MAAEALLEPRFAPERFRWAGRIVAMPEDRTGLKAARHLRTRPRPAPNDAHAQTTAAVEFPK